MDGPRFRIAGRAARVTDGLHPFQRQVAEVLATSEARVLCVEAPVGSGKSRVIRSLLEKPGDGRLLVLTYPTKILMLAQVNALRKEVAASGRDICVWPE